MLRLPTTWIASSMYFLALAAGCGGGSSAGNPDGGGASGAAGSQTTTGSGSGGGPTGGGAGSQTTTGTGGTGAGGTFSTGLPSGDVVAGLSDSDFAKLCASLDSFTVSAASKDLTCKSAGYTAGLLAAAFGAQSDADVQKACSDALASCQSGSADAGTTSTTTCNKPSASCTATVGEFEACLNDSIAEEQAVVASIPTCASLTISQLTVRSDGGAGTAGGEQPASCKTVNTECPGIDMNMN